MERKIKFLKYFNRPRVIVAIEIDIIAVVITSMVLTYAISTNLGVNLFLTVVLTISIAIFTYKAYNKTKEESVKGFIWHWLYSNGIWKIKEDPEEFPELNHLDISDVIPDGKIKQFHD